MEFSVVLPLFTVADAEFDVFAIEMFHGLINSRKLINHTIADIKCMSNQSGLDFFRQW